MILKKYSLLKRSATALLIVMISFPAHAQEIIKEADNYGAGRTQYIWNAYTGSGDVTNSYEFVPSGFNPGDPTTKYPVIFYFPGVGDVKTADKNSVLRLGLRAIPIELEGGAFSAGSFPFIVIGLQGSASSPASEYAEFMEEYVFTKFANKIDFSRIYLTGLSMGGGRIMEYMADPARAAKIAAIAPVALGTGCPYVEGCGPGSAYFNIINNIVNNSTMGAFFTHNIQDPTVTYQLSNGYVTGINGIQSGRAQFFFDPTNPNHDAWSTGYARNNNNFAGKNMYDWLIQFSLSTTLPVNFTSFTASSTQSKAVVLKWTTSSENNSQFFIVERSANGKDFNEIGKIPAAGNSNTRKDYSFIDQQPIAGTNYYRLKQTDKDGKFQYSATRKVILANMGLDISANPNPFSSQVALSITGSAKAMLKVSIADLSGRVIRTYDVQKTTERFSKTLPLGDLMSGIYILSVKGENVNFTTKLTKL